MRAITFRLFLFQFFHCHSPESIFQRPTDELRTSDFLEMGRLIDSQQQAIINCDLDCFHRSPISMWIIIHMIAHIFMWFKTPKKLTVDH
jgi:hypothetical protein